MAGSTVRKLQVVSPVPADIDIANAVEPLHIAEIAKELNLIPSHYDLYGKYKAKVLLSVLDDLKGHEDGYYVVVGGITPTPLGEGKSTTTVGLCQTLGAFLDKKYLRTTVRLTFEEGVEMFKEDLYAVVDWAYKIDPLRCINPDSRRKPPISEPQAPSPPGSCPSDCRRRDQQ